MGTVNRAASGPAPAARAIRLAAAGLLLALPLSACSGGDNPGPTTPAGTGPATEAPPSSSGGTPATRSPSGAGTTAPPLTGPLPAFTPNELADAAREVADLHPGSRVRTDEEISGLASSGKDLLRDMDIVPATCMPFMDNYEATLPSDASIASVTIPGDSVNSETYISIASYPETGAAGDAIAGTMGLLRSCGTFTLDIGGTEGTATLRKRTAETDAETGVAYWMDVAAGEQSVSSYTVAGSDGHVVVLASSQDDTDSGIEPEDVATMLDEALTALRTR